MEHVRGAPYHPQTQGKIERWHQTLKNRILLENYFLPGDLEKQIELFVDHYNHQRYHESLKNLGSSQVFGQNRNSANSLNQLIERHTPTPPCHSERRPDHPNRQQDSGRHHAPRLHASSFALAWAQASLEGPMILPSSTKACAGQRPQ